VRQDEIVSAGEMGFGGTFDDFFDDRPERHSSRNELARGIESTVARIDVTQMNFAFVPATGSAYGTRGCVKQRDVGSFPGEQDGKRTPEHSSTEHRDATLPFPSSHVRRAG
jgi:hypothetical protein